MAVKKKKNIKKSQVRWRQIRRKIAKTKLVRPYTRYHRLKKTTGRWSKIVRILVKLLNLAATGYSLYNLVESQLKKRKVD